MSVTESDSCFFLVVVVVFFTDLDLCLVTESAINVCVCVCAPRCQPSSLGCLKSVCLLLLLTVLPVSDMKLFSCFEIT